MLLPTAFLDALAKAEDRSSSPLTFLWPSPGHPGGKLISFPGFTDWQAFVFDLSMRRVVPKIVADKFERGQKLLLFAWVDFDLLPQPS